MSSIGDHVSRTDVPGYGDGLTDLPAASAMSPDALMAFLALRLRDADGQIETVMSALNDHTATAEKLSAILQLEQDLKAAGARTAHHVDGSSDVQDDDIQPDDFLHGSGFAGSTTHETPADAELCGDAVGRLDAMRAELGLPATPISYVDGDLSKPYYKASDIDNAVQDVTQRLHDVNSGNDQMMVQLQSLTQSRTTSIQMVTNMLKALNDSAASIAANMK